MMFVGSSEPSVLSLPDQIMALSPLGYWKLDENSGLPQDSSGNARHIASFGGTLNNTAGADGENYAVRSSSQQDAREIDRDIWSPATSGTITVFAIAYPTARNATLNMVVGKWGTSQWEWAAGINTDGSVAVTRYNTSGANVGELTSTTTPASADDVWHTLTWVVQPAAAAASLYHNGVKLTTNTPSGVMNTNGTLALSLWSHQQRFSGAIAHAAVFAGEMSDADIEDLHASAAADGWF